MDKHLYLVGRDTEEPLGLRHLKALVHKRSRVDGYLGSHVPCGMLEGIGSGHLLQLLLRIVAERTARAGKQYLVYLVIVLAHQTLEDGTVLTVYGEDGGMILLRQVTDQLTCHHQGLLVGKAYLLAGLDSMDGRLQSGESHHRSQHHVDGSSLHNIAESLCSGIHLDVRFVAQQFLQPVVVCLIGDDHCCRTELACLTGEFVYPVIGGKAINLIEVTVLLYDIKSLRTDASRRTEYAYLLFLHFPSLSLIFLQVEKF